VVNVLFVCLGNICRSPTAEGVFRELVDGSGLSATIGVDSAATSNWHLGKPPDPRTMAVALSRGYDLSRIRARQVTSADFHTFDYVLAMDRQNREDLGLVCPAGTEHRLRLFLDFAPDASMREVPDPYAGYTRDFERVLDLVIIGARGLLGHLRRLHGF
jgi:protein-tyrosine phosphatase